MTGLDSTLAALAEPTRRRVVELLLEKPRRPTELAEAIDASPPSMSRHLRVLRKSGLIEEERFDDDARARVYRLRAQPFQDLQRWLERMESFWKEQLGSFKQHVERKSW